MLLWTQARCQVLTLGWKTPVKSSVIATILSGPTGHRTWSTVRDLSKLCWTSDVRLPFHGEGCLSPWCCHSSQAWWALKRGALCSGRSPFGGRCRDATSLCPHWCCMIKANREGTNLRGSFSAHTVYCTSPVGSSGELGTEKSARFCLQNCSIWLSMSIWSVLTLSWACVWKRPTIRHSSSKQIMIWHAFKTSVDTVRKPACLGNRSYQLEESNSCSPHGRIRSKCCINGQ